jgi:trehalose 6-phosphate synthase
MNRIVVVSNRVPVPTAGAQAGGLAVVLGDLMAKRGGLWFGWGGGIAAEAGEGAVRITHAAGTDYATLALTPREHEGYYNGFSNGVLWSLFHTLPDLIQYDRRDAATYHDVNRRMASQLIPLLRASDLIWVHDYHLLPMAAALRARGVRNAIGFFLHIPFPGADVLAAVPGAAGLVRDMLEADLIGFQTEGDLSNFAVAAEAVAGASRRHGDLLQLGGRSIRLGVFPVEIEAREVARMARELSQCAAVRGLRRSLPEQQLIFGAERLDPSKGLLQRMAGYRHLLETRPEWRRRVGMLQIAATSRKDVGAYQSLRLAMDQAAGALNTDLGDPDWVPLRVVSRGVDRALVAAYMREARVGLVTPLRDGMNLVAKEFVAAQDPEDPGVLVLSSFAGAAQQLRDALIINPRDPEAIASALAAALSMPLEERTARWQSLWAAIEGRTPLGWGGAFIDALTRTKVLADSERAIRVRMRPTPARRSPATMGPTIGQTAVPPSLEAFAHKDAPTSPGAPLA